jgi:predicted lipoprotein with Yx(FWY)xxD motif
VLNPRITVAVLAVAATIGGVALATGGDSSPYRSPASRSLSDPAATITVANQVTVTAATPTVQGRVERILVDARGLPLYTYKFDTASTSMVTGRLATLWPPLLADTPTARGANAALMALQTSHGTQVSYNEHFLYTFVADSPGKVTGEGLQNFFVATPGTPASR